MRCDAIWYDLIRFHTIRYGMIRYDTIGYDRIQCDTIRYDTQVRILHIEGESRVEDIVSKLEEKLMMQARNPKP